MRFCDFDFLQTVKLIKLSDFGSYLSVRFMVIYQQNFLALSDNAVVQLTDADTTDIFIVINGGDEHLSPRLRITDGSRNIVDDGIKQRF